MLVAGPTQNKATRSYIASEPVSDRTANVALESVATLTQAALLCGFDFIVTPLARPEHRPPPPQPAVNGQLPLPFQRDDVLYLGSSQWVRQVSWRDAAARTHTHVVGGMMRRLLQAPDEPCMHSPTSVAI